MKLKAVLLDWIVSRKQAFERRDDTKQNARLLDIIFLIERS